MPDEAFYSCSYLSEHSDYDGHQILPTGGLPDELVRKTRHAYYAAVEFMDAMVGQVLDALEASGQADNTGEYRTPRQRELLVVWRAHVCVVLMTQ